MKYKAFTLAEVLVTLGIIGIVAAIMLPSVIEKQREKAIVASLKKTYSILNSAYSSAVSEYGTPDEWGLGDSTSPDAANNLADKFLPYLKTTTVCEPSKGKPCMPEGKYSFHFDKSAELTINNAQSWFKRAILSDGTTLIFSSSSPDCSSYGVICGNIDVDVNGFQKPNEYGYDVFQFFVTKKGVIPRGYPSAKAPLRFRDNCGNHFQGTSCAGWVIYMENMEYLRCKDLDWNGKTKCSK